MAKPPSKQETRFIYPKPLIKYDTMVSCINEYVSVWKGTYIIFLKKYLLNRKQRVILNGQSSPWLGITVTGSVLGALLFLITINDLSENYLNYLPMTLTLYYF